MNIFLILIKKFQNYYSKIKLKNLIKKLYKEYKGTNEVQIVSNRNKRLDLNPKINVELLSDFRININQRKFLRIKRKVIVL